jgi:uncharacterized protein YdeI (YjbR/CyaY-like superfamily)
MTQDAGSAPRFFTSAAQFRQWLQVHHDTATELVVGFHRVGAGKPTLTWTDAVREALCFGWIDGVVRRLDDTRYSRRFTPRSARSIWSAVNIRHAEALIAAGLMQRAGQAAFDARSADRSGVYSFEQRPVELPEPLVLPLREHASAWNYWTSQPKSYRQAAGWWVVSAKQQTTREKRLRALVDFCAKAQRIPQFVSTPRSPSPRKKDSPS